MNEKILITGASGLVGGRIAELLASEYELLTPAHNDIDIVDSTSVNHYVSVNKPPIIINCAAATDVSIGEKERGNTKGKYWQVNVEGTKNIVHAARSFGAFVIYLSTGSVFAGTDKNPGPFTESYPPGKADELSWYGWTKLMGERLVSDGAVIRVSHPTHRLYSGQAHTLDTERLSLQRSRLSLEKSHHLSYIHTIIELFDKGKLFPMFTDQSIPLTFSDDIAFAIKKLITTKQKGIYHIASYDVCTQFELGEYVLWKARGVKGKVVPGTFDEFIKLVDRPKRYTKYCAIDSAWTRKTLGLPKRSWREIVDMVTDELANRII